MTEEAAGVPESQEYPTVEYYKAGDAVPPDHAPRANRTRNKASKLAQKIAAEAQAKAEEGNGAAETSEVAETDEGKVSEPTSAPVEGGESGEAQASSGEADEVAAKTDGTDDSKASQKEPENLKAQFAALARAEKRIREEAKAKQSELDKQAAELEELRQLKNVADKDKYALLDHLGVDINEWAKKKLGEPDTPKEMTAESAKLIERIDALEKKNQELEQYRVQELQRAQYEQQKEQAVAQIEELMQTSPGKYDFTVARGGSEVVFSTIEEYYYNTGQLLPFEDALTMVEEHFEKDAESYLGVEKLRKKISPQGEAKEAVKTTPSDQKDESRSRTKQVNQAPDRVSTSRLSKKERRKRAAAVLSDH